MSRLKWVTSAAVLACAGALLGCDGDAGEAPVAAGNTGTPTAAPSSSAPATPTATPRSTGAPSAPSSGTVPVLSGKREVTIVRVQAFESGLSLHNGELVEADDDSGRQLFVPTPLGGDAYLIKAYGRPDGHPANDDASCWQVHHPGNTESLTVEAAACDAANPRQRFTIVAQGAGAYAISNESAFLQYSPTKGLILEELGDAPLLSTFRIVDNGPARRTAGG